MSRRIEDCHVELQMKLLACIQEWSNAGLDVLVTSTWRSDADQLALYEQGRTAPGRIGTNAKPGQSTHNYTVNGKPASLAFDVVPISHGKPVWGTSGEDIKTWLRVASRERPWLNIGNTAASLPLLLDLAGKHFGMTPREIL